MSHIVEIRPNCQKVRVYNRISVFLLVSTIALASLRKLKERGREMKEPKGERGEGYRLELERVGLHSYQTDQQPLNLLA